MSKSKATFSQTLLEKLRTHFQEELDGFPVVEESFGLYERPNLHLAFEEFLGEGGSPADLIGVVRMEDYAQPSLAKLSREHSQERFEAGSVTGD